jgi:peptidoglycan/xylan/chitin deacetylase (PgdA/CDA1 family)
MPPKLNILQKLFIGSVSLSFIIILLLSFGYIRISKSSQSENLGGFKFDLQQPTTLTLGQMCQKYQGVARELQPANSEPEIEEKVTFKSSRGTETVDLPAEPLPLINERAKSAKVPIAMYHDILPKKEVFFDVTPEELEEHFQLMKSEQVTPISLNQLVAHLRTGSPLPKKPILLTFDDGYGGHYEYVYPLLKKYNFPAVFSVYTSNMGIDTGRTHFTWEQLKEMAADPLITIAGHSKTHPPNLTKMTDEQLQQEIFESKKIIEENLGEPIHYFTYPAGHNDARVRELVAKAGYIAGLAMDDNNEIYAGESENLLAIGRIGQSRIKEMVAEAWGGGVPAECSSINFTSPISKQEKTIGRTPIVLISGGKPATIHADSRYQLQDIVKGTGAVAAVDGTFFSLKSLTSNVMIGPILTERGQKFVPGYKGENPKLNNRPLVLISDKVVKFIPFDADKHNTLEGIQAELESVNDAFVAAAWLVKDGQPQPRESFNNLFGFDAMRYRAFWGINTEGEPTLGVSTDNIDAVSLGEILVKAGFQDAVMLDSGASTSLVYQGESQVKYVPRPVPHAVVLYPPESAPVKENN